MLAKHKSHDLIDPTDFFMTIYYLNLLFILHLKMIHISSQHMHYDYIGIVKRYFRNNQSCRQVAKLFN